MRYTPPALTDLGSLTRITAADFTTTSTDSYILADGTPITVPGLTGSGPGCVDGNQDGTCDYLQQ